MSAAAILERLVTRHLDGRALPQTVVAADGMTLRDWLTELRHDRSDVSSHLASRMNMIATPATVSEVALSLRDRLIEAARCNRAGRARHVSAAVIGSLASI
jgi:hypothetical protein